MIFYFSGTGNSQQIAHDLADKINADELINLAYYNFKAPVAAQTVGIIFPTYFWGIPNVVERFIKKLTFSGNPYIYAVTTCGGTPGSALNQVNDLLKQKGLSLSSAFYIPMPENYIVSYNVPDENHQHQLFVQAEAQLDHIAETVMNRKVLKIKRGRFFIDGYLGYLVNDKAKKSFPTKDRYFTVNDRCIGCGQCTDVCQFHNISLVNDRPQWAHHCEFCLACINHCPTHAIDWKNKTQHRGRYINPNL